MSAARTGGAKPSPIFAGASFRVPAELAMDAPLAAPRDGSILIVSGGMAVPAEEIAGPGLEVASVNVVVTLPLGQDGAGLIALHFLDENANAGLIKEVAIDGQVVPASLDRGNRWVSQATTLRSFASADAISVTTGRSWRLKLTDAQVERVRQVSRSALGMLASNP